MNRSWKSVQFNFSWKIRRFDEGLKFLFQNCLRFLFYKMSHPTCGRLAFGLGRLPNKIPIYLPCLSCKHSGYVEFSLKEESGFLALFFIKSLVILSLFFLVVVVVLFSLCSVCLSFCHAFVCLILLLLFIFFRCMKKWNFFFFSSSIHGNGNKILPFEISQCNRNRIFSNVENIFYSYSKSFSNTNLVEFDK